MRVLSAVFRELCECILKAIWCYGVEVCKHCRTFSAAGQFVRHEWKFRNSAIRCFCFLSFHFDFRFTRLAIAVQSNPHNMSFSLSLISLYLRVTILTFKHIIHSKTFQFIYKSLYLSTLPACLLAHPKPKSRLCQLFQCIQVHLSISCTTICGCFFLVLFLFRVTSFAMTFYCSIEIETCQPEIIFLMLCGCEVACLLWCRSWIENEWLAQLLFFRNQLGQHQEHSNHFGKRFQFKSQHNTRKIIYLFFFWGFNLFSPLQNLNDQ